MRDDSELMSDADFELDLGRVQEEYNRANRIARRAFPTLEERQRAWDRCNKWHARLNALEGERLRRQIPRYTPAWLVREFVNQEIGA